MFPMFTGMSPMYLWFSMIIFLVILMMAVRVYTFQQADVVDITCPVAKMFMKVDPTTGKLTSMSFGSVNGSLAVGLLSLVGVLGTSYLMMMKSSPMGFY